MTHQQLIDFWAEQIKKHESNHRFALAHSLKGKNRHKDLADQARLIYMQLCKMDCEEPIVITSTDIPDTSFKGTVIPPINCQISKGMKTHIQMIEWVNDNFHKYATKMLMITRKLI